MPADGRVALQRREIPPQARLPINMLVVVAMSHFLPKRPTINNELSAADSLHSVVLCSYSLPDCSSTFL